MLASIALALSAQAVGEGVAAAETPATFGKTTVGGSSDVFAANRKRVNEYSLARAGAVSKLTVYLAPSSSSGQQVLKGVLYGNASGKPGSLLGTSAQLTFASGNAAGWYDLSFPSAINLAAGSYWIGVLSGEASKVAGFRFDSVASSRDYNSNTYGSGPSDPFGAVTIDSEQMSLYATYTPSSPLMAPSNTAPPMVGGTAAVGQTLSASTGSWTESPTSYEYAWQRCEAGGSGCAPIAGASASTYTVPSADAGSTLRVAVTASNSAGPSTPASSTPTAVVQQAPSTFGKSTVGASSDVLSANRKRVSEYTLPVPGSVAKLSVYLAPSGTAGKQVLEGVLYANSAGKPASLLGTTAPLTFTSTSVAGWYDLAFSSPLSLAAGSYWIGVLSGETSKVAGFRYDSVASSRDSNSNRFSSGPSDPFGAVTTDSKQASLYATYTASESDNDSTPPTTPQELTAGAASATQIDLSWKASSDDVGVAGYTIRREGVVVTTVSGTTTSYIDGGLSPSTTYSYTVDAFDSAGNHSQQSAAASAMTPAASQTQHYEYVFPSRAIDVYDMDNGQKLVKTIALPAAATDIRGAAACPATHILYVSYGHDSGASGGGVLLAYDLVAEKTLWTHSYPEGIDSMALTPNCKTIYMPVGEASSASNWNVLEASTGNITAAIEGGAGPHNTIVSLNGEHVYMGPRNGSYLTVADTSTNQVIKKVGPLLNGGVRPFTINGKQTFAFTTATGYLGFQVSSITSGQVLYTVPVLPSSEFPYTKGQAGPSSPSHGISLAPDEKELWVMDQPNSYVHVYDISGLPNSAPTQVANIKLTRPMTGNQVGCTYDCLREGWLQHSLDGRFVIVGDSGDVLDTRTRQSVANLEPLYNSRVFLEIDWSGGVPVATSTRSGLGYVTH